MNNPCKSGSPYAQCVAAPVRVAVALDPKAPATKSFHVRVNPYELDQLQQTADLDQSSKQRVMRRALLSYCSMRLKSRR